MKWVAAYVDGETLDSRAPYAAIDRSRLSEFAVLPDATDEVIVFTVPERARLVFRNRRRLDPTGVSEVGLVALESLDRKQVNLYLVHHDGRVQAFKTYGADAATCAPELLPEEGLCRL